MQYHIVCVNCIRVTVSRSTVKIQVKNRQGTGESWIEVVFRLYWDWIEIL